MGGGSADFIFMGARIFLILIVGDIFHCNSSPYGFNLDAAFLLTVGSFLLAVELSCLQLTNLAFLLTAGVFFFTYSFSFSTYSWSFFAYSEKVPLPRPRSETMVSIHL